MQKNVSGQKTIVFAFDSATSLPKSGDAANITAYVSKDWGAVTVLGDTSATEMDATNAKGFYLFDLTQAETNCNVALFSGKSSTAGIVVVGRIETLVPVNFSSRAISSVGAGDSNLVASGGYTYPIGTAQGGGNSTITLAAGTTNLQAVNGDIVILVGGTGAGQSAFISAFDNVTKIATIVGFWPIANPDSSTIYQLIKDGGGVPVTPDAVWSDTYVPVRKVTSPANITTDGSFASRETTIGIPVTTVAGDIANVKADTGSTATAVTAIQTKTAQMQFTPSSNLKVDVEEVKSSGGLSGNGSILTPWGPP